MIAKGNRLAFSQLYDRYWQSMTNQAFKVLKDVELSQDVVQEVFLQIWHKRAELNIGQLEPYLRKAVKYKVISTIRKARIPVSNLDFLDNLQVAAVQPNLVEYNELNQLLNEAIEELPPRCREVFILSRLENLSNKSIAAQLDISVHTVENHLVKAIALLRPKLKDYMVTSMGLSFLFYI